MRFCNDRQKGKKNHLFQETISTGPFVMRSTCRVCGGTRVVVKTPCTECAGKGKIILRKKVVVPVPAGKVVPHKGVAVIS